jgi:GNAT superfamily N-acetyltransferase
VTVRPARREDVPTLVQLVHELATYERAPESVVITEEGLAEHLFGSQPGVFAHVALRDEEIVGFAVWFLSYSTWRGQHGIYLEDLFVRPDARGSGLGRELLQTLAGIAVQRGYGRLEWQVLDWNSPAIGFYRTLGAKALDDWTMFRLTDSALTALGSAAHGTEGNEQPG